MRWMSPPISCLLGKNVVRGVLEGLAKLSVGQAMNDREVICYDAFAWIVACSRACITEQTYHLLTTDRRIGFSQLILPNLSCLRRGKYLKRWARRLQDFNFSYEDARILANATFGVDVDERTLGAEVVVTLDLVLLRRYRTHFARIERRLRRMTSQLDAPYHDVRLPEVLTPQELLSRFSVP